MIRITIEKVPFGMESQKHLLSVVEIVNDGSGSARMGNYDVYLGGREIPFFTARVEGHERTGAGGWLVLAAKALTALVVGLK